MKTISFLRKWLLLVLCVWMVSPALAARRMSEPQDEFVSDKSYKTQVVRAENDAKQAYILGCACERGKAGSGWDDEQDTWFLKAAEGGIPDAMYKIGVRYEKSRDLITAITWYKRASEKGLIEADCKLAYFYLTGVSKRIPADGANDPALYSRSVVYYGSYRNSVGANSGSSDTPRFFSKQVTAEEFQANDKSKEGTYTYKDVLPKDEQKALKLFAAAAQMNVPEANYQIGLCFEGGIGVPKNKKKAMEFYTKAMRQKHVDAKLAFGRCQE